MTYYHHPLKPEDITEQNHHEIASNLLDYQLLANIEYQARILKYGWSDDDTDYLRSALNATEALMDLAYDRSREDLINFLFGPRHDEGTYEDTLYDLWSAGGFCDQLAHYIPEEEDE